MLDILAVTAVAAVGTLVIFIVIILSEIRFQ